jgi:hypothetical protein
MAELNEQQRRIYDTQQHLIAQLTNWARDRYRRFRLSRAEIYSCMHDLYLETCQLYDPARLPEADFCRFLRYRYARAARRMLAATARGESINNFIYQIKHDMPSDMLPISEEIGKYLSMGPTEAEHTIEQKEIVEYIEAKIAPLHPIKQESIRIVLGLDRSSIKQLGRKHNILETTINLIARKAVKQFREMILHDYPEWTDALDNRVSLLVGRIKPGKRHARRNRSKSTTTANPAQTLGPTPD